MFGREVGGKDAEGGGVAVVLEQAPGGGSRRPRGARRPAMEETILQVAGSRADAAGAVATQGLLGRRLGQYQIESFLGQGSMACVYRARHLGLGRPCALKIMDAGLEEEQPGLRAQFWAEARAAANLVHPHVVTIHNLGSASGRHFIEMEYVPGGQTLRETLVRSGPLEPLRAAELARQIALALGAAHDSGMVHRDVKPANVLLTLEGKAKLADFGLVRRLDDLARGGAPLAGTPSFMAPELFQGTPASARTDIYALGVLLFHCLSGRLPFTADRVSELIQLHLKQPAPDIREHAPVPDPLAEIVARTLAKSPDERFGSAVELARALQVVLHRPLDTETLVREAASGLDGFIQGARDTFRVILSLPGDRLQEVVIEGTEDGDERHLTVFSVCGPADPSYYSYALELNGQLTYGSISIHHVLGAPMFVMSRTFPRDSVRAEDVRDALIEIARRSDHIEKKLTRLDQY